MRGLSCYTASLYEYLASEWDACSILARSVRLAVRPDLPDGQLAFSHHEPSLDRLPDGSFLRYAGAECPAAALPQVADDLAAHGRVIVVADSASLPWSVTQGGPPAPHWLLIDGKIGDRWHVTDTFTALLPAGEQPPYAGWLGTRQLSTAMTLPACWKPQQQVRNTLAFGSPVIVPADGTLWLRRGPGRPEPACPGGHWLSGSAQVLGFLIGYLTQRGTGSEHYLDDLWAAAGHRAFACRWRLSQDPGSHRRHALQQALSHWEDLPRLLRIAELSAQRGRPRPTLVRTALEELLQAEDDLS